MKNRRPYEKYLDRGVRGWIVSTAKRNYWRIAEWYDLEDLIQDGFLAFAICKARYGDRVENKAHFMALFKRIYSSLIHDMASKRTRIEVAGLEEVAISQVAFAGYELTALEYLAGAIPGDAEVYTILTRAPAEVKRLLAEMDHGCLRDRRFKPRQDRKTGYRETNNEFLNRRLGTRYDYEKNMKRLLKGEDLGVSLHKNLLSQPRTVVRFPPMESRLPLSLSSWLRAGSAGGVRGGESGLQELGRRLRIVKGVPKLAGVDV